MIRYQNFWMEEMMQFRRAIMVVIGVGMLGLLVFGVLVQPPSALDGTILAQQPDVLPPNGLPRLPAGLQIGMIYTDPEPAAENALDAVFGETLASGLGAYQLALSWAQLEPEPGQYDLSMLAMLLDILDTVGLHTYLSLTTIDTVNLTLPGDLVDARDPARLAEGRHFDDPLVLARFAALLDELLPLLAEHDVFFVSVGNEVDGWLGARPAEAEQFVTFVQAARAHIQSFVPDIGVGAALMYAGVVSDQPFVDALLATSDAAAYTYYPLDAGFRVRDPAVVANDMALLVQRAGDLPVLFQEVGYPSGRLPEPGNGSSEALQAEFVRNIFAAIAEHPSIRMVSFLQLSDWPDELCTYLQGYYGLNSEAFHEFLCSLGLHTYSGTPKAGYAAFLEGMRALNR